MMMRSCAAIGLVTLVLTSCGGGDRGRIEFTLTLVGLGELGPTMGTYEGFAVVSGVARSTGKFRIDASFTPPRVTSPNGTRVYGTTMGANFGPAVTLLGEQFPFIQLAESFFVTIEPEGDNDGVPSGNTVLAGTFDPATSMANLEFLSAVQAPGSTPDLDQAQGTALLLNATQTGGPDARGIWFVNSPPPLAATGLALPELTGQWRYQGWVTNGATTLSTGTFRDVLGIDDDAQLAPTRGPDSIGLLFPGQDFAVAADVGGATSRDLVTSGEWRVEVTVEPERDNSVAAFPLRLFNAAIPVDAVNPMTGVSALEIALEATLAELPTAIATRGPGTLALGAQLLANLGPAPAGVYGLYVVTAGTPALLTEFVVDPITGDLGTPDGLMNFGAQSGASFTAANTDPAAFATLGAADAISIALLPQGGAQPTIVPLDLLHGTFGVGGDPDTADLGLSGAVADFTGITGSFICITPTNDAPGVPADDAYGVWFRRRNFVSRSLFVPELAPGWVYEGWVVNDVFAERFSTGRFRSAISADRDAATWPGRGSEGIGFNFPGQDFLNDVPPVTVPPQDLTLGFTAMVSLEPFPDNDPAPFLPLLSGIVPGTTLTPFSLTSIAGALPSGQVVFSP